MVVDFGDIKAAWADLDAQLDHSLLNDVDGLSNPTAEVMAQWIYDKLVARLPQLAAVTVWETATSSARYEP
jgi:6-pyruvoyltetrahydropterin/6-carboxytetrahydropterin synthase